MAMSPTRGATVGIATVIAVAVAAVLVWGGGQESEPGAAETSLATGSSSSDSRSASPAVDASGSDAPAPSQETPAPTVIADVAPTLDPAQVSSDVSAEELAEPFIEAKAKALTAPDQIDQDTAITVADDVALEALLASAAEYEERGWRQVGSPAVVSTEVESIKRDIKPVTAVLRVCLDYVGVDIVDAAGDSVLDQNAATRVLNIFEMHFVKGRWVLVNQSFPDDMTC